MQPDLAVAGWFLSSLSQPLCGDWLFGRVSSVGVVDGLVRQHVQMMRNRARPRVRIGGADRGRRLGYSVAGPMDCTAAVFEPDDHGLAGPPLARPRHRLGTLRRTLARQAFAGGRAPHFPRQTTASRHCSGTAESSGGGQVAGFDGFYKIKRVGMADEQREHTQRVAVP